MSEHEFGSDPWLDAKLRNVPIPVDLVAKLSDISAAAGAQHAVSLAPQDGADIQLDAALANVSVPAGLLGRLYAIPGESRRLAVHRAERRRRWHLPELAVAAAMLIAAGVFYLGWLSGQHSTLSNIAENGGSSIAPPDSLVNDDGSSVPLESHEGKLQPSTNALAGDEAVRPEVIESDGTAAGDDSLPIVVPGDFEPINVNSAGQVFGNDPVIDSLPELYSVSLTTALGAAPPRVNGYDLLFQLRHGDHPFVSPSADKQLASLSVPLETSTKSYLAWAHAIRSGRPLDRDSIRTEHFLAAMDYSFPPPADASVAIRTAAGPAPSDTTGLRLLQVGVQATSLPSAHAPVHLTVALEASAAMARSGGFEMAKDALLDIARSLGEGDRLSVIVFSEARELMISEARLGDISQIEAVLDSLRPGRTANLASAVEQATSVSRRASAAVSRKVTFITTGLAELSPEANEHLGSTLAEATASGITLEAITIAGDSPGTSVATSETAADNPSRLAELVAAAKGRAISAETAADVRFALLESLTGQNQAVARKVSLKIMFNPQAVDRYRLVGHEAKTLTAPDYAPLEIDLRSGEAATALVELWLKPTGGDDVATAELSWQDPKSGAPSKTTQRISRLQFAKSFAETPASLQSAYLSAQTAEALRGSYYATASRSLRQVLELAESASTEVQSQPQMHELLQLVSQALALQARAGSPASVPASADSASP